MALFKRDWRKILEKHVRLLEYYNLLSPKWKWDRKKIRSLEKLDKWLISDLIHLHNSNHLQGEKIPVLIALLKRLHEELTNHGKTQGFERFDEREQARITELLNNIQRILHEQKSFTHVTYEERTGIEKQHEADLRAYHEAHSRWIASGEGPEPPYPTQALRRLKKLWNERADRKFLQKVKTIHWCAKEDCDYLLSNYPQTAAIELSCVGFLRDPYHSEWKYGLGLIVEGWVTFAANRDLGAVFDSAHTKNRKYSEKAKDLIVNKSTFVKGKIHNEFLVANWKPMGIVVDMDFIARNHKSSDFGGRKRFYGMPFRRLLVSHYIGYAHSFKLNLFDERGSILYNPESTHLAKRLYGGVKGFFPN